MDSKTFLLAASCDTDYDARPNLAVVTISAERARVLLGYMDKVRALSKEEGHRVESLLVWDGSVDFYRVDDIHEAEEDWPAEHLAVLEVAARVDDESSVEEVDERDWERYGASQPDSLAVRTEADQAIVGATYVRWQAWDKYGNFRYATAEMVRDDLQDIVGLGVPDVKRALPLLYELRHHYGVEESDLVSVTERIDEIVRVLGGPKPPYPEAK